jgi:DNA-binding LacI/PurR family transcriptional regulator
MSKKIKNKDLAARLGVSGTLVSLVLNNKADQHGISKETQEKVLMMARQMGYFNYLDEKNVVSPVEETPGVIGMVVTSACDYFVSGITPYLQTAFSSIGMGFSIITRDPDDQRFDRMISAFRKFYSGLILVGSAADDGTVRALRSTDYPFMLLENDNMQGRLNSVTTDNAAGAGLIAKHVHKLGYKNVVIATDKSMSRTYREQIGQMEDALAQMHSVMKPVTIELDRTASDDDYNFMQLETFLRPPFRADVVITMQSKLVYPLMNLFRKKKLRVPQDIALISAEEGIGFDIMYSPVTCIKRPFASMATKVANMVWTEIKNSGKGKFKRQVTIVPELVVRNSCGTL